PADPSHRARRRGALPAGRRDRPGGGQAGDRQVPEGGPIQMTAAPTPSPTPSMELSYAPHEKSRNRSLVVLAAGLASTVVALVGVMLISHYGDENVMGWYANYVIPAGAVLVGLVAS